jgi:hypothetical protein
MIKMQDINKSTIFLTFQVLAPLETKDIFTADDFELLETLDMDTYARKIRNKVSFLNL